jgi:DNA polymerase
VKDARVLRELELEGVVRLFRRASESRAEPPCADAQVARDAVTGGVGRVREAPTASARTPVARADEAPPAAARTAELVASLDWDGLRDAVRDCHLCGLCARRKQAVLGVGDVHADWLFVGEGPGADEDEQGEPFVGQAGKLLDGMLRAIGLTRGEAVYIANVVKCRPPGNRTPTPDEAQACAPFLDRQVELVQPKLIVALGKTAATRLLGTEASLASLRGRAHSYRGIPLVVTYHPAYLLRSLPEKAKAWEDLLFARRTLRQAA